MRSRVASTFSRVLCFRAQSREWLLDAVDNGGLAAKAARAASTLRDGSRIKQTATAIVDTASFGRERVTEPHICVCSRSCKLSKRISSASERTSASLRAISISKGPQLLTNSRTTLSSALRRLH